MGIETAASNPLMWIGLVVALIFLVIGIAIGKSKKSQLERQARHDKKMDELDKARKDKEPGKP